MKIIKIFSLITLVLLSANLIFVQSVFADSEVFFECANFKNAITKITGKETITIEDMQKFEGKLDLSYQEITSLVGLEYAVNVEELILSFNNIVDISPILQLENLKSLYIDYNWLKELPDEKTKLVSLEHLDISNNEIKKIPTGFIDMPELKRLYMGDLALEEVPDFSSVKNTLNRLDISGAKIIDFSFVESLTNIELLIMNGCGMKNLPELSQMNNLAYLYFANNNISVLPEYLGSLPLIRLDFSGNFVSSMPQSFANLTKLEQLVFTDNYFTVLPAAVTQMRNLEVLMCGQNIIEVVPINLSDLKNIKRASFASNNLADLHMFTNFEIPYSYQISFDLNYLDLNDATNIEVLDDYRNDGGTQKKAMLQAEVISADTQSVIINCSIDQVELERLGTDLSYHAIKLFAIQNGELQIVGETAFSGGENPTLVVTYENPPIGSIDYLVCLVLKDQAWPPKYIKYSNVLEDIQVVQAITPTQLETALETTQIPEISPTNTPVSQKGINTKYLLYILLLGVIIIISAIIAHILINRRR